GQHGEDAADRVRLRLLCGDARRLLRLRRPGPAGERAADVGRSDHVVRSQWQHLRRHAERRRAELRPGARHRPGRPGHHRRPDEPARLRRPPAPARLRRTLSYDNATNLTIGATSGAASVQFGYGGHQQRVLKQVASQSPTIYFTGSSKLPIARMDGSTWSALVYGPTGLVAVHADQAYYPIKDNERSVWAVVDANGLVAQYTYLPFGAMTAAAGPNPNVLAYRFMGQEWDAELSLYSFGGRMYDPVLRRYLSPDPAQQFPSPYVFAANNPLTVTDPTGDLSLWARIGIGLGMAAVLVLGIALTVAPAGAAAPPTAAAGGGPVGAPE